MRGGITSGVVYPKALARLAETYRFRCIGGTSAGAVAATVAAAASYGKGNGRGGFERLKQLPEELGERKNGETLLLSLCKPQTATRSLFRVGLAAVGRCSFVELATTLLGAFPLGALIGGGLAGSAILPDAGHRSQVRDADSPHLGLSSLGSVPIDDGGTGVSGTQVS